MKVDITLLIDDVTGDVAGHLHFDDGQVATLRCRYVKGTPRTWMHDTGEAIAQELEKWLDGVLDQWPTPR
jgi:hypothetical protein